MKTTSLLISCLLLVAQTATASTLRVEKVLVEQNFQISVPLTTETVRCSAIGYGSSELKVSVPDLKWISPFNHANDGELEPCMTAGRCARTLVGFGSSDPTQTPDFVIQTAGPQAKTTLHRKLIEVYVLNTAERKCRRTLLERVEMSIAGKSFTHSRSADMGEFAFDLCEQAVR